MTEATETKWSRWSPSARLSFARFALQESRCHFILLDKRGRSSKNSPSEIPRESIGEIGRACDFRHLRCVLLRLFPVAALYATHLHLFTGTPGIRRHPVRARKCAIDSRKIRASTRENNRPSWVSSRHEWAILQRTLESITLVSLFERQVQRKDNGARRLGIVLSISRFSRRKKMGAIASPLHSRSMSRKEYRIWQLFRGEKFHAVERKQCYVRQ